MKWAALFLALAAPAFAAPEESVKFTPVLKFYECPPNFVYRSDCKLTERALDPQKLVLDIEVMEQLVGRWTFRDASTAPVMYHVIVVRSKSDKKFEYSVSVEAGLNSSPTPISNARAEFSDDNIPRAFGVASAVFEKDGKKFLAELRLKDFHGVAPPAKSKR